MQASFKKQLFRRVLISSAMIAAFVIVIIILNIDINKRAARIELLKTANALKVDTVSAISELKKNAQIAAAYDDKLRGILPARDDLIGFPRELQKLAEGRGLNFGFTFGSEVPSTDATVGVTNFSMTLAGKLEGLLGFLRDFERHSYFTSLSAVDISRKNNDFTLSTSGEIYTR